MLFSPICRYLLYPLQQKAEMHLTALNSKSECFTIFNYI